jgi:hypothetical protein
MHKFTSQLHCPENSMHLHNYNMTLDRKKSPIANTLRNNKQHFDNSSFKTTQLLHITQNEPFHWQTKLPFFIRTFRAKHNGTVVKLNKNSGGAWFQSQPGYHLSLLSLFMVFLSPPGKCHKPLPTRSSPIHHSSSRILVFNTT